jgi:hypothetical protein
MALWKINWLPKGGKGIESSGKTCRNLLEFRQIRSRWSSNLSSLFFGPTLHRPLSLEEALLWLVIRMWLGYGCSVADPAVADSRLCWAGRAASPPTVCSAWRSDQAQQLIRSELCFLFGVANLARNQHVVLRYRRYTYRRRSQYTQWEGRQLF